MKILNRITKQLRDESQTYPDGLRFLRGLLNKLRSSILFANKCKRQLVMGCALFSTKKKNGSEESFVNEADYTGHPAYACNYRAQFSERLGYFCHYFPLCCYRRGWRVAHETLLTFIIYSVIILGWQVGWHTFILGWQLPPHATPVDLPLSLTDFWKGPSRSDSLAHFCLERSYKLRLLPEVPFKGAKKQFGIRPMSLLPF